MCLLVYAWSCVLTPFVVVWILRYMYVFQAGLVELCIVLCWFYQAKNSDPWFTSIWTICVHTPCMLVMCDSLPFRFVCFSLRLFQPWTCWHWFNHRCVDFVIFLPISSLSPSGLWSRVQRLRRTYCSSLGVSLWKEFCLSAPTQTIKLRLHFPARQRLPHRSSQWRWEVWPTRDHGASSHCRRRWIGASGWTTVGSRSWGVWGRGWGYVYTSGDKLIIFFQIPPYALVCSLYFVSLTIDESWWYIHFPILGLLLSYRRNMAFTPQWVLNTRVNTNKKLC